MKQPKSSNSGAKIKNFKPFISPNQIDLQNRHNQSSLKNPCNYNSIHNLIPLLVQTPGSHNHQEPLPLLGNLGRRFAIPEPEIQAGPKPFSIGLFPKLSLRLGEISPHKPMSRQWHHHAGRQQSRVAVDEVGSFRRNERRHGRE